MCFVDGLVSVDRLRISLNRTHCVGLAFVVCVLIAPGLEAADVPFAEGFTIDSTFDAAQSVVAVDIDGDGDTDVVGGAGSGQLAWWANVTGDGTAWQKHSVGNVAFGVEAVFAADVNGDGRMDVLTIGFYRVTWWENVDGQGTTWTERNVDPYFVQGKTIFTADIDRDGDTDVVGGAAQATYQVAWWENVDGLGTVWQKTTVDGNFKHVTDVFAADIDGDGDQDILGSAVDVYPYLDRVVWWENDDPLASPWTMRVVDGDVEGARSVRAVDIDGDGDSDLVCAVTSMNEIAWWENVNPLSGEWWTKRIVASGFHSPVSVHATDVDRDGDPDILGAAYYGNEIAWWENTDGGGDEWTKHLVVEDFDQAVSVFAADVDADGDADILGASETLGDVDWWENMLVEFDVQLEKIGGAIQASDVGAPENPSVDISSNGEFVVFFPSTVDGSSGVFVRSFDSLGQPQADEFRVDDPGVACGDQGQNGVAVEAGELSDFVVTWEGGSCGLLGRSFLGPQEPEFEPFEVCPEGFWGPSHPDIARLSDDRLVIAWYPGQFTILNSLEPPVDPTIQSVGFYGNRVASSPDGGFWIAGDDLGEILVRRYDDAGSAIGDPTPLAAVGYLPDVETLTDGRAVACWESTEIIKCQLLNADGSLDGPPFEVNTVVTGNVISPHLASDSDGNFIVVWNRVDLDSDYALFAQVFDKDGQKIGTEVEFLVTPPGGSSSMAAGAHIVSMNGTGDVVIVWKSPDASIYAQRFRVYPPPSIPVAEFAWDPPGPVEFEEIQFTDESRYGPPTQWSWDFGDGSTSEDQNPVHAFAGAGDYQVALSVANDAGSDAIARTVHVTERLIPLADFSWTPQSPIVGDDVMFIDRSTFGPTTWAWDFDNDGQTDSFAQAPDSQSFQTPGIRRVWLTVANNYGSHSIHYDIEVLPDPNAPIEPYVSRVTSRYAPGYFLQDMSVENTFAVEVNWQGSPQGSVRFSTDSGVWCEAPDPNGVYTHTFNMASDFQPSMTGSTITIAPADSSCDQDAGPPRIETVFVFPYPTWLASVLGAMGLDIDIFADEVIASIGADFPDPHLAVHCSPDSDPPYDGCNSLPEWVPLLGEDPDVSGDVPSGIFDLVETYARFEGSVSTLGSGTLSLYGQTGFCAMDGCVFGSIGGSGGFELGIPNGLVITQTSFNLHLEGFLSKSVTLSDIPQVEPITNVPIIGPVIKEITDRATLTGQIAPYLDLSATWAQNIEGDLVFAHGEGTLGLDLKAILALDLGVLNLSAWVAGGGSFTLGLPEDPLIRAAEIHAQLGLEASLSYTFKIFWKTITLSLSKTATLDIGCAYVYPDPWGCYAELDLMKMADRLLDEAGVVRVIEHDYGRFGEYAVFKAEPVPRTKSAKVPVAVARTKIVENLFPGAAPAIAEAGPDMLLVWVHDDTADQDLESTEIAWSIGVWEPLPEPKWNWSVPEWIANDTQAELDPVLGVTPDGEVVAAWLRIKDPDFIDTLGGDPIDEVWELPKFYTRLDVVSAVFDPGAREWYDFKVISPLDDESMDIDLQLASDTAGNLMLTWLSNEAGHFSPVFNPEDPTDPPPSYLYSSFWGADGFDTPVALPVEMWGVSSHASAISGDRAVVLIPRDPELSVIGDEVIELCEWNGATWSVPTTFAMDAAGSRAPSVVFDDTGEGHVVWLQGDDLVKATLSDPTPTVLRAGSSSMAFLGAKLLNNPSGNITLIWQEVVDNQPADIFAMVYDPATDTWSVDRRLTDKSGLDHGDYLVHQASAGYDSSSVLHAAYLITEISRDEAVFTIHDQTWPEPMNNIPVELQTNLMVMTHELIVDLAVGDDDVRVHPIPDDPNDRLKATLTVHNAGFFATAVPDVDLYLGDPDADGEWIGAFIATDLPAQFKAGATMEFELEFDPPVNPGNLVAVVDGSNVISEEWEDNNRATWYRENLPPVAVVKADSTVVVETLPVTFDGSSSFDLDGDALTMRWSFADGTSSETGTPVTHAFVEPGGYPVTLSVTDDHGAVDTTAVLIDVLGVEEAMARAIAFFDEGLLEGSITGLGTNPVSRAMLFRKLLVAAESLIDAGDVAGACKELTKAAAKSDGRPGPPDLIEGDDVPELNRMLLEIIAALGC